MLKAYGRWGVLVGKSGCMHEACNYRQLSSREVSRVKRACRSNCPLVKPVAKEFQHNQYYQYECDYN